MIVATVLYVFAVDAGIGMGYHRLLVHRGYQVPKAVEYFLAVCGTLALEGGPMVWVCGSPSHAQEPRPGRSHDSYDHPLILNSWEERPGLCSPCIQLG